MSPFFLPILLGLLCSLLLYHRRRIAVACPKDGRKLPPGPTPLPIIGNLQMLGRLPHQALQSLAQKYGPIMSLRLGSVQTVILSSPETAELILKTHDSACASRPKIQAFEYLSYGSKGLAFSAYSPYWRAMRKLCVVELLGPAKIQGFAGLRREEVVAMVRWLRRAAAAREVVNLSLKVAEVIEDLTCRMVFGRRKDERIDLKKVVEEAVELAGMFNIADFVPFLGPIDLQGITRRLKSTSQTLDKILQIIITEHEQEQDSGKSKDDRDFLDVLLSLKSIKHGEQSISIDQTNIKAMAVDMIVGAFDTSSVAIDWIMTELIRHPRVMKKLKEELKNVVGDDRMVEEEDLAQLNYLDMIIKETMRLHPVAPLLGPRESTEDIFLDQYFIPSKSRIIVNAWAIGRDPRVWSDNVHEFLPERFVGSDIDLKGQHFQLTPFGSGRRGCPGMQLGLTTVRLVAAQLVHCFDWELPDDMSPSDLDMSEKFGLSLPRAKPLLAIPTWRLIATDV